MASSKSAAQAVDLWDQHEAIIAEYRKALFAKVATESHRYPPVIIGPTWKVRPDGHWSLPKRTLGWDVLGWCGCWLQHDRETPWRFTLEQARFILWWYALDADGNFIYRDGVLQRLKGWGKDPIGACICAVELLGPCRFAGWDEHGQPIAKDQPNAWVQTCAVSLEQTKNTMRLFPGLFSAAAKLAFDLQVGKETIYALGGTRFMQAHTSSPSTMEGNRVTFILCNETHLWVTTNDGHDMTEVIRRNAAKAPDGSTRSLRITNAYEPGLDSVAERDREAWEKMRSGESLTTGLLYDSLEAPPEATLTAEDAPEVVASIRGDSKWLQVRNILAEIMDTRNAPSKSRRWWYNQIWASEESWTTPQEWDLNAKPRELVEGEQIVTFFDGSKSDDATGYVGCALADGYVFTIGVWERPQHATEWTVPREVVWDLVERTHAMFDVRAAFADPGSGEDDEGQKYWYPMLDKWNLTYGEKLDVKALDSGPDKHAIIWDMRSPTRQGLFTRACEAALTDIKDKAFPHDGNYTMRSHAANARRRPNQFGVSIGKESRESLRKIDLAVCAIGARMLRRIWLALPDNKKHKKKTGRMMYA